MRTSTDFAAAVRGGRRARRGVLVVHHAAHHAARVGEADRPDRPGSPALVGLVVGRSVGDSVTRHRVSRRLRHELRGLLAELPDDSLTVVRALPESAVATSSRLRADLDSALATLLRASAAVPAAVGP